MMEGAMHVWGMGVSMWEISLRLLNFAVMNLKLL